MEWYGMKKLISLFSAVLVLIVSPVLMANEGTYWYKRDMTPVPSPDAYALEHIITLKNSDGSDMIDCSDMFIDESGLLYVLNSAKGEVCVYQNDGTLKTKISVFKADSEEFTLNNPMGIFVNKNGNVYIADTDNNRILMCDAGGNNAKTFGFPEGTQELKETADYLPLKITVDSSGRMFVAAKAVTNGLLSLTRNGEFITYLGAPTVAVNPFIAFWGRFVTEEQRKRIISYVPTEYNNITIDPSGFIYGSIGAITEKEFEDLLLSGDTGGEITGVRKINTVGQDILRREGTLPIVGDLQKKAQSKIVDVALGESGTYFLMDSAGGHVFSYDSSGNILFAFGDLSERDGGFSQPVALGSFGDRLYVLDAKLAQIIVFRRTAYGNVLFSALEEQENGNFDVSFKAWEQVMSLNPMMDLAYIGTGNLYMQQGEYKKAMQCFENAKDMENYALAFEANRKESLESAMPIIFAAVVIIIAAAVLLTPIRRVYKYCTERDEVIVSGEKDA